MVSQDEIEKNFRNLIEKLVKSFEGNDVGAFWIVHRQLFDLWINKINFELHKPEQTNKKVVLDFQDNATPKLQMIEDKLKELNKLHDEVMNKTESHSVPLTLEATPKPEQKEEIKE